MPERTGEQERHAPVVVGPELGGQIVVGRTEDVFVSHFKFGDQIDRLRACDRCQKRKQIPEDQISTIARWFGDKVEMPRSRTSGSR